MSTSTKAQRKLNLSALCDADQYEPVVAGCLTDKQSKALPPRHLANFLSLAAELFLTHYDGISHSFEINNGAEVSLKLQLGPQKDELRLSYKPANEVKDSAMATVPDPDQVEMDFAKPKPKPPESAPAPATVVDVAAVPEPLLGLPAPEETEEEKQAYLDGREASANGRAFSTNPNLFKSAAWFAWVKGWDDGRRRCEDPDEQEEEAPQERDTPDEDGTSYL
ncbi:hypothetical protein OKA04_12730 [Luteolibacter flavescens]|uniref:Uncharacterized protein n=1 Tax=Luteolibacter flavescens TaxID=1859460 RepID=A0ABT3FPT8_9BACT|nr:hypothetical protein [Luteolibacter flavescens]MCW1885596.1 hypothetical protein [Luteolibacter flavescens]